MKMIKMKKGDTLRWTCAYKEGGATHALPDVIRAQLKNYVGELVATLVVVRIDEVLGLFRIEAPVGTEDSLPVGVLYCDIETETAGVVISTETFLVSVEKGITDV